MACLTALTGAEATVLASEYGLRLVRVEELLASEGVNVPYSTLRRFAHEELGWRERRTTVRVDDPPPADGTVMFASINAI